jgi:hypothetical protein
MASVYERLKHLQVGELVKMATSNAAELAWIEERNRDNSAGTPCRLAPPKAGTPAPGQPSTRSLCERPACQSNRRPEPSSVSQ